MTTTSEVTSRLLSDTSFANVRSPDELVGRTVILRVTTGGDDYDIIGTTVQTARIRVGDSSKPEWIELTFPDQFVTCNLIRNNKSRGYKIIRAMKYSGDKHWWLDVRRTGILGYFGLEQSLYCHIRPKAVTQSALAA